MQGRADLTESCGAVSIELKCGACSLSLGLRRVDHLKEAKSLDGVIKVLSMYGMTEMRWAQTEYLDREFVYLCIPLKR
jgi:hypothetical protein